MAQLTGKWGRGKRLDPTPAFERWARTGLVRKAHALLVAMLRGNPTLLLDSCSVRAKRGGDLTGSNPTDRGKKGTEYHVAVNGDGIPVACVATAANVNDTVFVRAPVLGRLCRRGLHPHRVRRPQLRAEGNRALCHNFGAEPHVHKRRQPSGSSLGKRGWPVERSNAWLLENKRLVLRYDRLGFIVRLLS